MTLKEALIGADDRYAFGAVRVVPADMLCLRSSEFTLETYKALRSLLEGYVRSVGFMARLEAVKSLNGVCGAFFSDRFPKLCRVEKVFDSTELDILLLKELQGGSDDALYEKTQADRADAFDMSVNAIQARIHALEDGKEILGHVAKIQIDGRGRAAYDNTIHPVFLTLNLKEANFLTVVLKQAFAGTPSENTANDISNDIYSQLSDYAKEIIDRNASEKGMTFASNDPAEKLPYRSESKDMLYFLKSGERCLVQMPDGTAYSGHIKLNGTGFIMLTDDGAEILLSEGVSAYSLL